MSITPPPLPYELQALEPHLSRRTLAAHHGHHHAAYVAKTRSLSTTGSPAKQLLLSPQWIRAVNWGERTVSVALTRQQVEQSTEYDPDHPPSREYERTLHQHYSRPRYWE